MSRAYHSENAWYRERMKLPDKKMCTTCKKAKPIDEFYKDNARPDGKCIYCKPCLAAYRLQYFQKKAQMRRDRQLTT